MNGGRKRSGYTMNPTRVKFSTVRFEKRLPLDGLESGVTQSSNSCEMHNPPGAACKKSIVPRAWLANTPIINQVTIHSAVARVQLKNRMALKNMKTPVNFLATMVLGAIICCAQQTPTPAQPPAS